MDFFIFVLFVCFFIFLFCLHFLSRDDFVLLRRDISIERVFNIAFIVGALSLFSSRILYVALNPSEKFLNPLVFFLIPYYSGLSLIGGVVGGFLTLLLLSRLKKMPEGRFLDFFSISTLSAMPIGFLGLLLLRGKNFSLVFVVLALIYFALFVLFIKVLLPRLLEGKFKDGTIGFIFLISFCIISLIENAIDRGVKNLFNPRIEDFVLLLIFFVSLVFLFRQEKLLTKVKRLNFKNIAGLTKR